MNFKQGRRAPFLWLEFEEAIGVHVSRQDHRFDFVAPFGFESLFD
ncbi:protein of unknown function [Shewanella benthica]|uniref:Uncharacterized protein n=1 Tax=Shewanella benthica TaxID=43661 RepID=A0A330M1H0_9GAMM|nr:protein of unknown function [Shewanella benthica]